MQLLRRPGSQKWCTWHQHPAGQVGRQDRKWRLLQEAELVPLLPRVPCIKLLADRVIWSKTGLCSAQLLPRRPIGVLQQVTSERGPQESCNLIGGDADHKSSSRHSLTAMCAPASSPCCCEHLLLLLAQSCIL